MQSSLFDSNINSGTYDCQNTSTYETATKSSHENPEQARGVFLLVNLRLKYYLSMKV